MIKKMFRFVFKCLLWVLFLLIIALVGIYCYLGALVREGINRYVPPITGTTASVQDVDLSLLKGRVEINNLQIGNPKGFSSNDIFKLGKIQVLFDPKSVLTDRIVIQSVLISGTQVSAEMKNLYSLDSNVSALQANINNYIGGGTPKTEKAQQEKATPKSAGKTVVIKDLQIKETALSLGVSGQTVTILLPDIHQTGIGEGKKDKSPAEIFADVLNMISLESVKGVATAVSDLAKQGWKGAKDLMKGGANTVSDTAKSVTDTAKGTVDGIKGLFK